MICDRCGQESLSSIGSMFNTDQLCDPCKEKEVAHPMYPEARRVEMEAVKNGDYNFPGIGLPSDLR